MNQMEGKRSAGQQSGTWATALPDIQGGEATGVQMKQKAKDRHQQIASSAIIHL